MQKTVKIGEKEVEMRATAATAIRYRNVFHEDIMTELISMDPSKIDAKVIEKIEQLGFIMAKTAEGANMATLSQDDFVDWLDKFDSIELMQASKDIVMVYIGGKASKSELKKTETGIATVQ